MVFLSKLSVRGTRLCRTKVPTSICVIETRLLSPKLRTLSSYNGEWTVIGAHRSKQPSLLQGLPAWQTLKLHRSTEEQEMLTLTRFCDYSQKPDWALLLLLPA